jgi:hypothetical protein
MSLVIREDDAMTTICDYDEFTNQIYDDEYDKPNGNGNGAIDCVKIEGSKEITVGTSNTFSAPVTFKVDQMNMEKCNVYLISMRTIFANFNKTFSCQF